MTVGSRAQVKGKTLVVSAGYSHPVEVVPPEGITFKVENNTNNTIKASILKRAAAISREAESKKKND